MGLDYKQKYLKYKIKYLNAKKTFKGGQICGTTAATSIDSPTDLVENKLQEE